MPTYQHEIYVAIYDSTPSPAPTGYWDSPFDGGRPNPTSDPVIDAANASKFDSIMQTTVAGQTVRLLPGTFSTTGFQNSASVGWDARSGVRVCGSGMGATTLKLVGVTGATPRFAVGMNFASNSLGGGFELSDLLIDCGLASAGTGTTVGAVQVRGKHIFLRRIRVVNYGTKNSAATIRVITAGGDGSENCQIEDCIVDSHPAAHVGKAILFSFDTTTGFHSFCSIRNCAGRGVNTFEQPPAISTLDWAAIAPGAGLGTVIEGNQFANVYHGIYGSVTAARDIAIWNNVFRNVQKGMSWDQQNTAVADRFIISDNIIELNREIGAPVGLEFTGTSANRFKDVVVRKNFIHQVDDTAHSLANATGISAKHVTRLIVESNVIKDAGTNPNPVYPLAVVFANCGSTKFFNNQDAAGQFQHGHDTATGAAVLELEDAVQDVLLAL